jgi:hypothetical protein
MQKKSKISKKVKSYWKEYETYTSKLSIVCRRLAFAEGAAFWILKPNNEKLPIIIVLGLLILVLYFISDTLQYLIGMLGYEELADEAREKLASNPSIKLSDINNSKVNKRIEFFLYLKLIFIFISSIVLIVAFSIPFICAN